jgi:hypothetical protein
MSGFPWEVFVLGLVLGINRLGTPATYQRPVAFWGIQVMNLALAVPVAIRGISGTENFPALGWLIAGLLVFHVLQNISLRTVALRRIRQEEQAREQQRKLRALDATTSATADDAPREAPPE